MQDNINITNKMKPRKVSDLGIAITAKNSESTKNVISKDFISSPDRTGTTYDGESQIEEMSVGIIQK